jgi:single-strand DNA-binding protein
MEVVGKLKVIGQVETVSEKFKKREIVVEIEGQYPQFIPMQLTQDKVSLAGFLQVGQQVKCHINLRGREWTSKEGSVKYFLTLEIWKIDAEKVETADY